MESRSLSDYFYPVVGGILLLISPYVIVYEGNTLIGTAFGILGLSLLVDEWVSGDSGEDEEVDT